MISLKTKKSRASYPLSNNHSIYLVESPWGLYTQNKVLYRKFIRSESYFARLVPTASRITRGRPIFLSWSEDLTCSNYFEMILNPNSLLGAMRTESASVSNPSLPARPTICLYCEVVITYPLPALTEAITTLLAGKFTPVAKVVVQKRTFKSLFLNRCSATILSSRLSPAWW